MFWLTVRFNELIKQILWGDVRKPKTIAFLSALVAPLQTIYDKTLYQMQHDGRTIYLEKILNEFFEVANYNSQNHEATKVVYIEDVDNGKKIYVYQDLESDVSFLEDEPDTIDDLFLDGDGDGDSAYSFVIFIPETFNFTEARLRALIDQYRYIGKKYIIQTYTV